MKSRRRSSRRSRRCRRSKKRSSRSNKRSSRSNKRSGRSKNKSCSRLRHKSFRAANSFGPNDNNTAACTAMVVAPTGPPVRDLLHTYLFSGSYSSADFSNIDQISNMYSVDQVVAAIKETRENYGDMWLAAFDRNAFLRFPFSSDMGEFKALVLYLYMLCKLGRFGRTLYLEFTKVVAMDGVMERYFSIIECVVQLISSPQVTIVSLHVLCRVEADRDFCFDAKKESIISACLKKEAHVLTVSAINPRVDMALQVASLINRLRRHINAISNGAGCDVNEQDLIIYGRDGKKQVHGMGGSKHTQHMQYRSYNYVSPALRQLAPGDASKKFMICALRPKETVLLLMDTNNTLKRLPHNGPAPALAIPLDSGTALLDSQPVFPAMLWSSPPPPSTAVLPLSRSPIRQRKRVVNEASSSTAPLNPPSGIGGSGAPRLLRPPSSGSNVNPPLLMTTAGGKRVRSDSDSADMDAAHALGSLGTAVGMRNEYFHPGYDNRAELEAANVLGSMGMRVDEDVDLDLDAARVLGRMGMRSEQDADIGAAAHGLQALAHYDVPPAVRRQGGRKGSTGGRRKKKRRR